MNLQNQIEKMLAMHVDKHGHHLVRLRCRSYVDARKPFAADEDDHTKMNAWVLYVWQP